jgi:predicted MPP superfamily phosphohydrolase
MLIVYGLLNLYVVRRGWQALAGAQTARWIFLGVAIFLVLSYPLSRLATRILPQFLSTLLSEAGGIFIAALIYAFFLLLIIDLLRLINALFRIFPEFIAGNPQKAAFVSFWAVLGVIALILIGGILAAVHPRIRRLDLAIEKKAGTLERLNIVMVSDIHLGAFYGDGHLKKIVARINGLKPDLVLLAGDIVDMVISPNEEDKMVVTLQAIQAPLGVFAVTGNHEYYGGLAKNLAYLSKAKVRVLQDEFVKIEEAFYLVGRKDRSAERMGNGRKSLGEILQGMDKSLPLILMDHQPFHLEEAEQNGIDLQVSGHTHAGQLFPINLINKRMYEQYWGYWRRGKTQYYITCGVGTWGMPVRTGSVSEIVQLMVTFR